MTGKLNSIKDQNPSNQIGNNGIKHHSNTTTKCHITITLPQDMPGLIFGEAGLQSGDPCTDSGQKPLRIEPG